MKVDESCFESILGEIEMDFKHVADKLKLLIGHAEFEMAISKIIVDDRGSRQGFPPRMMAMLLKLSKLHTKRYGHLSPQTDPWHNATFK